MVTGLARGLLVMYWLDSRIETRCMHGCWADSLVSLDQEENHDGMTVAA